MWKLHMKHLIPAMMMLALSQAVSAQHSIISAPVLFEAKDQQFNLNGELIIRDSSGTG